MSADRWVVVCSRCCTASCWHGEFMCDGSHAAGVVKARPADLDRLGFEHPSHYSRAKVERVHGGPPDVSGMLELFP